METAHGRALSAQRFESKGRTLANTAAVSFLLVRFAPCWMRPFFDALQHRMNVRLEDLRFSEAIEYFLFMRCAEAYSRCSEASFEGWKGFQALYTPK
jgi:hypothetical protein